MRLNDFLTGDLRVAASAASLLLFLGFATGCGPKDDDPEPDGGTTGNDVVEDAGDTGVAPDTADTGVADTNTDGGPTDTDETQDASDTSTGDTAGDADGGTDADGGNPLGYLPAVDEVVHEEMLKQELMGVGVGVVKNGKVVHAKGYGYADLENQVPADENTLFRWASISKPLTSTAALQLFDKGDMDLDKDIRDYAHGYRMIDVDAYPRSGGTQYAGIWVDNKENYDWRENRNLTSSRFGQLFQQYRSQGFRIIDVDAYEVGGNTRFAGIWVKDNKNLDWKEHRNLTSSQFSQYFQQYRSKYYMIDVEAYQYGGNLRFAGIWVENKQNISWRENRNLTSSQFSQKFNDYKQQGFRMIDIESYRSGGTQYYAGIWVENKPKIGWAEHRNLTSSQFHQKFNTYRQMGWRLIDVEGYKQSSSTTYYAGIWAENTDDVRWREHRNLTSQQFGDYFDIYRGYPSKMAGTVTMRDLLTNRSGTRHYTGLNNWDNGWPQSWTDRWSTWRDRRDDYYDTKAAWNPDTSIAFFKDAPLLFTPGSQYNYTTFGFNLAATVAEYVGQDAEDRGYVELVQDNIATPMGMTTLQPDYSEFKTLPNRTKGFSMSCDSWIGEQDTDDVSYKLGGGGWISNVEDLTLFMKGLMNEELLSSSTQTLMQTNPAGGSGYGYGLDVRSQWFGHGGSQQNTRTLMRWWPADNLGVVVMVNSTHVWRTHMLQRIAKAAGGSTGVSSFDRFRQLNCDDSCQNSSTYEHSGVWRKGGAEQYLRRGYSFKGFQAQWKWMDSLGFQPVDIETYRSSDGQRRWDGAFEKKSGKHAMWRGFDHSGFLQKWQEMNNQGYRLIDLETYTDQQGNRLWAGVFEQGTGQAAMYRNLDQQAFHDKWDELNGKGQRLIDIETYKNSQGKRLWAGVWRQGTGGYALFRNYKTQPFATKRTEQANKGNYLVDLETYTGSDGSQLWAGVWRASSDDEKLNRNWSVCGFYDKHRTWTNQGYRLVDLEVH